MSKDVEQEPGPGGTDPAGTEEGGAEFESLARGRAAGESSAFVQLLLYVRESRSWWLLPVIIALILAGILIVMGGSAAAPFIYTLF